jgi:hypothetical protein
VSDGKGKIERVLDEAGQPADATAETPLEPDLHPDRTRQFTHTSFSRARMAWLQDDQERLHEVIAITDEIIAGEFRVAFSVLESLRKRVRSPLTDGDGVVQTYDDGSPKWETDEHGVPVENWSRLDPDTRNTALFLLTTYLVEWEMRSADKWAEAMFAKVAWEERFAHGFTALPGVQITGKPTIDDRTQWGHALSVEERYFAVFCSALSRKAEALVKSMIRLQRLLENTATS